LAWSKVVFILKPAVETAKYPNHAKEQGFLKRLPFPQRVKWFGQRKLSFGSLFSRVSRISRFISIAVSRFIRVHPWLKNLQPPGSNLENPVYPVNPVCFTPPAARFQPHPPTANEKNFKKKFRIATS
jgi:hypothetical protein